MSKIHEVAAKTGKKLSDEDVNKYANLAQTLKQQRDAQKASAAPPQATGGFSRLFSNANKQLSQQLAQNPALKQQIEAANPRTYADFNSAQELYDYRLKNTKENDKGNAVSQAIQADIDALDRRRKELEHEQWYHTAEEMERINAQYSPEEAVYSPEQIALAREYERLPDYANQLDALYTQRIGEEDRIRRDKKIQEYENVRGNLNYMENVAKGRIVASPDWDVVLDKHLSALVGRERETSQAAKSHAAREFTDSLANPAEWAAQHADQLLEADIKGDTVASYGLTEPLYLYMTPEQRDVYSYYVSTGGREKADEYFESIKQDLRVSRNNERSEYQRQWAEANPVVAFITRPFNQLGTLANIPETIKQEFQNSEWFGDGIDRPLDTSVSAFDASRLGEAYAQGITNTVDSEFGKFMLNVGFSLSDNAVAAGVGVILGPGASAALLSAESGSAALYEAGERGLSPSEASKTAVITGGWEYLTEKIAFDELFDTIKAAPKSMTAQKLQNILKQSGVEASEEYANSLLSTMTERIVMGGNSSYDQYVRDLQAQGATYEEAVDAANLQFYWLQPLESAAAGFMSGGIMSTSGTVVSDISNIGQTFKTPEQKAAASTLAGITQREQSGSSTVADTVAEKVLTGETPSNSEIRQLQNATTTIQRAFESMTGIEVVGVDSSNLRASIAAAIKNPVLTADMATQVRQGLEQMTAPHVQNTTMPQAAPQYNALNYNAPDASAIGTIDAARQGGAPLDVATVQDTGSAANIAQDFRERQVERRDRQPDSNPDLEAVKAKWEGFIKEKIAHPEQTKADAQRVIDIYKQAFDLGAEDVLTGIERYTKSDRSPSSLNKNLDAYAQGMVDNLEKAIEKIGAPIDLDTSDLEKATAEYAGSSRKSAAIYESAQTAMTRKAATALLDKIQGDTQAFRNIERLADAANMTVPGYIYNNLHDAAIGANPESVDSFVTAVRAAVKTSESRTDNRNPTGDADIRFSARKSNVAVAITLESTEKERYDILKNTEVAFTDVDHSKIEDVDLEQFKTRKKSSVERPLVTLADKLGITNVDFENSYINIPFVLTKKNLRISLHHQLEYGGTYADYVKAMSCLEELVKNAVLIETHPDYKSGTPYADNDLKQVYVMLGVMRDGRALVPVEIEVKENINRDNQLYLTVMLTKIDLEVVDAGLAEQVGSMQHLVSRSKISVAEILKRVNPLDAEFLKYVPDGFLDEEQKKAKVEALNRRRARFFARTSTPTTDIDTVIDRIESGEFSVSQMRDIAAQIGYKLTGKTKGAMAEELAGAVDMAAGMNPDLSLDVPQAAAPKAAPKAAKVTPKTTAKEKAAPKLTRQQKAVKAAQGNVSPRANLTKVRDVNWKTAGGQEVSFVEVDPISYTYGDQSLTEDYRATVHLAEAFGEDVVWAAGRGLVVDGVDFSKDGGTWGGFTTNGKIVLNAENMEEAYRWTVGHEIGHRAMDNMSPEERHQFVQDYYTLRRTWAERTGTTDQLEARINDIINERVYDTGDPDAVMMELIADDVGDFLHDEQFARYAIGENANLWQRITRAIGRVLRQIQAAFAGKHRYYRELQQLHAMALNVLNDYRNVQAQRGSSLGDRLAGTAPRVNQNSLPKNILRNVQNAKLLADMKAGRYQGREYRNVSESKWEGSTVLSDRELTGVTDRRAREADNYGYRKVNDNGRQVTIFVTNPNAQSLTAQKKSNVAAMRSLAAATGMRIGFGTGTKIAYNKKVGETGEAWDIIRSDGTTYVNLDSPNAYTALLGQQWYDRYAAANPARARTLNRLMARASKLTGRNATAQQFAAEQITSAALSNYIATPRAMMSAKALAMKPSEILETIASDRALLRSVAKQHPTVFRLAADAVGDLIAKHRGKADQRVQRILAQAEANLNYALAQTADENRDVEEGGKIETAKRKSMPEGVRFMYAGENAQTANRSMLKQAQDMIDDGVEPETVRQETGWFKGMDGRWRFEIDDSTAQYHRAGDARFSRMHADYARHQTLLNKMLNGQISPEEHAELRKLDEVWGRERGRLNERVDRGNATLDEILDHEALFEAYPELRNVKVRFEVMYDGERGSYDRKSNTIKLSSDLRDAPTDTLLHEIQHAVQASEGFSGGASPIYWAAQMSHEEVTEQLDRERREILSSLGRSDANKYARFEDLDLAMESMLESEDFENNAELQERYVRLEAESDKLYRELHPHDWFRRLQDIRRQSDNPSEIYRNMYHNTAGEIEARDTAVRRPLSREQRKNTRPDVDRTDVVFADDSRYNENRNGGKDNGETQNDGGRSTQTTPTEQRNAGRRPSGERRRGGTVRQGLGDFIRDSQRRGERRVSGVQGSVLSFKTLSTDKVQRTLIEATKTLAKINGVRIVFTDGRVRIHKDGENVTRGYAVTAANDTVYVCATEIPEGAELQVLCHEKCHIAQNRNADAGFTKYVIEHIDRNSKSCEDLLADIGISADMIDTNAKEIAAYISGWFGEGKDFASSILGDSFRDFDALISAWQRMIEAVESSKPGSNQGSSYNDINSVLREPTRTERRAWLDDYADTYGQIPEGEDVNSRGDQRIPRRIDSETKTRQTYRTYAEALTTPDDFVGELEKEIVDGRASYTPLSNKAAAGYAERKLAEGMEEAMATWNAVTHGDVIADKNQIALGERLIIEAINNRDVKLFTKLVSEVAAEATRAGQMVQAISMVKRLSPEGQLVSFQKEVSKLNESLANRKGHPQITPDETLTQEYMDIASELESVRQEISDLERTPEGKRTERQQDAIDSLETQEKKLEQQLRDKKNEMITDAAEQVPSTWMDKLRAWRYLAMLGNPRTHIRNLLGNAVFIPAVRIKQGIAGGIERMTRVKPGERTQGIRASKELRDFAREDAKTQLDILASGGKYNQTDAITAEQKPFDDSKVIGKTLNKLADINSAALEGEDAFFLRRHYEFALSRFAAANKWTVDYLKRSPEALAKARGFAYREAQRATYRDLSSFAQLMSKVSNKLSKARGFGKLGYMMFEGAMPFKKTPCNIMKRGIEYSPLGIATAISKGAIMLRDRHNGVQSDYSGTEFINDLAAGMTGTMIMGLGYLLTSLGMLHGRDKDEEDEINAIQGVQEYSVIIGGYSYTVDWVTPVAFPLFVGSELYDQISADRDGYTLDDFYDSLAGIAEPLFSLSMMDGVQSMMQSYSSEGAIFEAGMSAAESYVGQYFPTISGQLARTVTPEVHSSSYRDKTDTMPDFLSGVVQKAMAKIPGAYGELPEMIDVWGRNVGSDESWYQRAAENFLSPGYLERIETTDADRLVQDLYRETGDAAVIPGSASKYFTVNGKRYDMEPDEYVAYAKTRGKTSYGILTDFYNSKEFKQLTAEQQVSCVETAYKFATAIAKSQTNSGYVIDVKWQREAYDAFLAGEITLAQAIIEYKTK